MCDLSRELLQPLSVVEKAKSIHRLSDATALEIELSNYIVNNEVTQVKQCILRRLKEVKKLLEWYEQDEYDGLCDSDAYDDLCELITELKEDKLNLNK